MYHYLINKKYFFLTVVLIGIFLLSLVSSGVINPLSLGFGGRSYATNFEIWVQSFNTANVTPMYVIGGQNYSLPPWYASSNSCDASNPSQFNQGCNIGNENLTNFCMATDEISQWALTLSMSQNVSNEAEIIGLLNTIDALNVSTDNSLTEWKSSYNAVNGINKSHVADSASDADARFILALANVYRSDVFSASTKARANIKLTDMCGDFVDRNFLKISRTSNANSSETIDYWPCGGTNVCTDLTNNDFMFSGYYGDNALALGACGVHTGNSTYFTVATDLAENFFAAANWTNNSQLRFPPGRSFKWNNAGAGQTPYATDTSGVAYIDTPDAKRFTSLCTAGYMFTLSGRTLHPRLQTYCDLIESVSDGWAATNYSHEWWPNGTIHSTAQDSYSNNGLALQIDLLANPNNVQNRLDYIWSNKWDDTNKDFFIDCQGLYDPSFPVHSMGYAIGYLDGAMGESGSLEIGNNAISIILREPNNATTTTNTSVLLRVSVTNNNVSAMSSVTFDTVPKVYNNCTFNSDNCAWLGGSHISGGDGFLNLTGNVFSPTQNLSRYRNSSTFLIEQVYRFSIGTSVSTFKFYPMTDVGSFGSNDRFYLENNTDNTFHLKHEPNFETITSSIPANSNSTLRIILNKTGNTHVMMANITWTNNTANGSAQSAWLAWSAAQNTSYTNHVNGTGVEISGAFIGTPRLYDQYVLNRGVNASNIVTIAGNSSMNVSFINAVSGAVIGSRNNVSSGGDANITWSNLSLGTYRWFVNVTSENNRVSSSVVEFTIAAESSGGGSSSSNNCNGITSVLVGAVGLLVPMAIIFIVLVFIGAFGLLSGSRNLGGGTKTNGSLLGIGALVFVSLAVILAVGVYLVSTLPC